MSGGRRFAAVALGLGVMAALAGSPYRLAHGRVDVSALASRVAAGEGRLDAVTLASLIKDARAGLRILDVRDADAFERFRLPLAARAPMAELVRTSLAPGDLVVLYDDDGVTAAQAWILLTAAGIDDVYYLDRGLAGWFDEVLSPTIAEDASPEARAAFERVAALSRYFGGQPRIVPAGTASDKPDRPAAPSTPGGIAARLRHGCG